jgi:RNA polymerase sigma factor (sigma-70 family)
MVTNAQVAAGSERMVEDTFLARVEEHKRILFRVANGYCANPQDRQDLVQDIVVQLWRSYGRFDSRYRFSTWMYRIALNVAISFYRSETRRVKNTAPADDRIFEIAAVDPESSADHEKLGQLNRFIDRLDELHRALMILHLEGNSYDTIAEILGISETNVASKISRIKQKFRREFQRIEADQE